MTRPRNPVLAFLAAVLAVAAALLIVLITACSASHVPSQPHDGDAGPPTPQELVDVGLALDASSLAIGLGASVAHDWRVCVGLTASAEAAHGAAVALYSEAEGAPGYPALDVDLTPCQGLPELSPVDVPAQLETASGRLLAILERRIATGKGSCIDRARLAGAVRYLKGAAIASLGELTEPDWKFTVPAATVDLSGCG